MSRRDAHIVSHYKLYECCTNDSFATCFQKGTIHYGLDWPDDQYSEAGITLDHEIYGNFAETFHVYSVEREPGVLRFFVDNILFSTRKAQDILPYRWPFDEKFYFILNLAVGGNWPGMPDNTTVFPQQMQVDYVRVLDRSFPRIDGIAQVDAFTSSVVYTVVNDDDGTGVDTYYTWSVPADATIESGQGTRTVSVAFGQKAGIISVETTRRTTGVQQSQQSSSCVNLPGTVGLRVKVLDTSHYAEYDFDCGNPESCSPAVLNTYAGTYTCGERINWLIDSEGYSEEEACRSVAQEQNGVCGGCFA